MIASSKHIPLPYAYSKFNQNTFFSGILIFVFFYICFRVILQLNSGQDAFYYQLFVEKDERLNFPTVQQLFEQSFLASDIKLKEVPSCLIIQMPRFGKNFKMYSRILPSQVLDVTDVIEGCKYYAFPLEQTSITCPNSHD